MVAIKDLSVYSSQHKQYISGDKYLGKALSMTEIY